MCIRDSDELSQKATDPNIDMEDIKQLETEKAGLQQRFNIVERPVSYTHLTLPTN
ncbi:hypothetical protein JMUB7518_28050 [Staphylococcus aureus]